MKKTKLLTSLAAFVLVLGLGACNNNEQAEEEEKGVEVDCVIVGDFPDNAWDTEPGTDSKYYIPAGTTHYEVSVDIADVSWDAGLRVVEYGTWNLVVGYDELDGASTGVNGEGGDKNILVDTNATYDLVIDFGETNSILVTLQEDGGNEGEVQQAILLGSFNFATNEKNGVGISSSSDLDEFWTGDADLYRGVSEYDTVYLGNGTGGAFANVTTLLKFGTGSANGKLQLKFAVGTCISEVVVTAHSWYSISEEYPEQEPNQLVVNGTSQDCSVSGTATELRYEITDDLERFVTFESVGRVTIHSIDIYGTYEPDRIDPITALTLTTDSAEISIGETTNISVSYEPDTTIFDLDDLTWTSSAENVATVVATNDGALVNALAAGETTITATATNGINGSVLITVKGHTSGETVSQEFTTATIMAAYPEFTIGSGSNPAETCYLSGHTTTLGDVSIVWEANEGTGVRLWSDGIRIYKSASFTVTVGSNSLTNIVLTAVNSATASSNPNDFAEMTVDGGEKAITDLSQSGDGKVLTITPTDDATSVTVTLPSSASSNTFVSNIVVNYVVA